VDALAVVRRAAGECRDACEQRARVVVAVPEGTAWVRERPGDLELLLRELGQNARDAMGAVPDPEVRFEAELRAGPVPDLPGAGSPRHLVLRVVDNGAGMSPEVLRRIGEPLFTTKPVGRGTGLGLASAFGAVRGMGGRLSCESRLGAGTTFTALLPLDDRAAAQEGPPPPELAGRRVLLVDDDGMVRAALARQLQALGLEVATAAGGAQAMARLDVERFDALLLDLDMPGVTGLDVLLHVQRVAPDLPVLVITAAFDAERLAGAMAVLAKPVDGPALRAALLAALGHGGQRG
jgi:CheY-like chemotaxis protein